MQLHLFHLHDFASNALQFLPALCMATKTERERRKEETRREEKRKEGKGREEKRDEERHHCTQTATFFTLSFVLRVAIALPLRCHCIAIAPGKFKHQAEKTS